MRSTLVTRVSKVKDLEEAEFDQLISAPPSPTLPLYNCANCNDEDQWWSWKGLQCKGAVALTHNLGNFSGRMVNICWSRKMRFLPQLGTTSNRKKAFFHFQILSWTETAAVILRSPHSGFISKHILLLFHFSCVLTYCRKEKTTIEISQ